MDVAKLLSALKYNHDNGKLNATQKTSIEQLLLSGDSGMISTAATLMETWAGPGHAGILSTPTSDFRKSQNLDYAQQFLCEANEVVI